MFDEINKFLKKFEKACLGLIFREERVRRFLNISRTKQDMENPRSAWTSWINSIDYHIKFATNTFYLDLDRLASSTKNNTYFRHCRFTHYITLSSFHTPFTPKVTSGALAKLCTTFSVCECKQMSFQLLFESTGISKFLDTKWKIVPCFGSGVGEASFTELSLQ